MSNLSLLVKTRDIIGSRSSRKLRKEGKVPATIYGLKTKPYSVSVNIKDFEAEAARTKNVYSSVFNLKINDQEDIQTIVKKVDRHPVTENIHHIDFIGLPKKGRVKLILKVRFINKDKSPGLKKGGFLNITRRYIEVFCDVASGSFPEEIVIDANKLDIGSAIKTNNLSLPENISPCIKRNFTIATLTGKKGKNMQEEDSSQVAQDKEESESKDGKKEEKEKTPAK